MEVAFVAYFEVILIGLTLHSAAIYGLRGKQDVSIYILYPYGRVSPIQEQQMATVPDENVHCVAVDGTFDDCQVREPR
jgi:threonine synthase